MSQHTCSICGVETSEYPIKCQKCNAVLCDTHAAVGKCICKSEFVIDKIRRSGLVTYETCPFQFKLAYIDGHKDADDGNVWSRVGNIIHEICEGIAMDKEARQTQDLIDEYIVRLNEFKNNSKHLFYSAQTLIKGDIYDNMVTRGISSITNYINYNKTAPTAISVEEYFEFKLDEHTPTITCTIDRINDLGDGEFEISDIKTGKTFVGQKLASDLQPPVYILAFKSKYGKLPKRFTFVFTETERIRTYEQISEDIYQCKVNNKIYTFSLDETTKRIKRVFAGIQNGNFNIPQKMNYFYCENFCSAKQMNLCAGPDLQNWFNK